MDLPLLQSQLKGHFISDAIGVLQKKIDKGPEEMSKAIYDLQALFRSLMEVSIKAKPTNGSQKHKGILLGEEVRFLKLYLLFMRQIYNQKFNYQVDTNDVVLNNHRIPPLLIQPFIENAIKHGLLDADGKPIKEAHGLVKLNIFEEEGYLIIQIQDNGMRIEASKMIHRAPGKESRSISLISDQIELLNQPEPFISLSTISSEKGTIITLTLES